MVKPECDNQYEGNLVWLNLALESGISNCIHLKCPNLEVHIISMCHLSSSMCR